MLARRRAGSFMCRLEAGIDERAGSRVHYEDQTWKKNGTLPGSKVRVGGLWASARGLRAGMQGERVGLFRRGFFPCPLYPHMNPA